MGELPGEFSFRFPTVPKDTFSRIAERNRNIEEADYLITELKEDEPDFAEHLELSSQMTLLPYESEFANPQDSPNLRTQIAKQQFFGAAMVHRALKDTSSLLPKITKETIESPSEGVIIVRAGESQEEREAKQAIMREFEKSSLGEYSEENPDIMRWLISQPPLVKSGGEMYYQMKRRQYMIESIRKMFG